MRKILSKSFLLKITGTSDIYQNFGLIANLCQDVDVLPHERFDNVMQAVETFDKMLDWIGLDFPIGVGGWIPQGIIFQ